MSWARGTRRRRRRAAAAVVTDLLAISPLAGPAATAHDRRTPDEAVELVRRLELARPGR